MTIEGASPGGSQASLVADFARDLADGAITPEAPSDQFMPVERAFGLALSISLQRLEKNKCQKNGR